MSRLRSRSPSPPSPFPNNRTILHVQPFDRKNSPNFKRLSCPVYNRFFLLFPVRNIFSSCANEPLSFCSRTAVRRHRTPDRYAAVISEKCVTPTDGPLPAIPIHSKRSVPACFVSGTGFCLNFRPTFEPSPRFPILICISSYFHCHGNPPIKRSHLRRMFRQSPPSFAACLVPRPFLRAASRKSFQKFCLLRCLIFLPPPSACIERRS